MSTKINETYYGAENTFVDLGRTYVKRSPYNIGNLFTNGNYTGGAVDMSAAPWGIGNSSASSDFEFIAQKGATWTIEKLTRKKGNTPLFLYINSGLALGALSNADLVGADNTSDNYEKALFKCRISPDAENDSNNLKSTLTVDSGDNVSIADALSNFPITYLDYQHIRLYIDHVYYKPVGSNTIEKCSMNDIEADRVYVDYIAYFDCRLCYDSATGTNPNATGVHCSIGGNEVDISETFQSVYYGDNNKFVRPWRYIERFGYWYIDTNWYSGDSFRYTSSDNINYKSAWETLGNSDFVYANPVNVGWSHVSDIQQDFGGLKYHWNFGLSVYNANQWEITDIKTGDAYASGTYSSYAYLEVDEIPEGMSKNQAYFNAVLHECSFLGFPIVLNHISIYHSFGEADVYLPVFDEHQITTGDFKNGAESLSLPCAQWGDIFGSSMPDYDPDYDPEPSPSENDDYGDTTNKGAARGIFPSQYNIYLLSNLDFRSLTADLNSYYQNKTPDDWTIDFQGVNPSDYIVGLYYTPYNFAKSENKTAIQIGNVTLTTTAYELSQGSIGVDDPNKWKYFSYGTRTVPPLYYDFRDYAPYTAVELYLPLAGSIDLDPSYVMGHNISVEYYFDVLTMSGVAAVYRDDMLYKCSNFKLGASIPLLSSNMGAIQQQITQLENAQKQNEMRLAAGVISAVGGIGATIATGGAALPAIAAVGAGAINILSAAEKSDELQYAVEHNAPSVSQTGAAEPLNNYSVGQLMPKLIIKRPLMLSNLDDAVYSHTVGNACLLNNTVGDNSGLTVCADVDLSGIPATAAEINAIQSLLTGGIYV